MGQPNGRTSARVLALGGTLALLLAVIASCGDQPADSTNGRLLVRSRDISDVWFVWDTILYARSAGNDRNELWAVGAAGGTPVRLVDGLWHSSDRAWPTPGLTKGDRLFVWRVAAGSNARFLTVIQRAASPSDAPPEQPALSLQTISDRELAEPLAVSNNGAFIAAKAGPSSDDPLLVGPPEALQPVSVPGAGIEPGAFAFAGDRLIVMARALPTSELALWSVDVHTGAASMVVAPEFETNEGGREVKSPRILPGCSSSTGNRCLALQIVGCDDTSASMTCPGAAAPLCLVFFTRQMSTGEASPAVLNVATGHQVSLPGLRPEEGFFPSPDGLVVAWHDFELEGTVVLRERLRYWNLCTGSMEVCETLGGPQAKIRWRHDSLVAAATLSYANTLVLLPRQSGGCFQPVGSSDKVTDFGFSPDGEHLFWTDASGDSPHILVSDGDGFGAHEIPNDDFGQDTGFSSDGRYLLASRIGAQDSALVSFDLSMDLPVEQLVSPSVVFFRVGASHIAHLGSWNGQDATGALKMTNLATGEGSTINRAVSVFEVNGPVAPGTPVAYVVHNRYPSDRDGLWIGALP